MLPESKASSGAQVDSIEIAEIVGSKSWRQCRPLQKIRFPVQAMAPKHIGIIIPERAVASHVSTTADAFAAAALDDGFGGRIPCYRIWSIGVKGGPVTTESGLSLTPQTTLENSPSLDTVIIAGSSNQNRINLRDPLFEWILQRVSETRRIAVLGTGIYSLAPTGLLDGREVTTHWKMTREVAARFPALRVSHLRRVVKDGPFYTSAGLTSGVDLALALTEEDYGIHVAQSARRELMAYLAPAKLMEDESPRQDLEGQTVDRFGGLVAWIMRNLSNDLTVDVMAKRACMCPSHFTRSFKGVFGSTPGEFVENLRLNEARRRVSTRKKTIRSVAASVGLPSAEAFHRAFERRFGVGAGSYLETGGDHQPVAATKRKNVALSHAA